MAKILIDVSLNTKPAQADAKALKNVLTSVVSSLKGIDINKDLTAQLNALSKVLDSTARNTKANAKETEANAKANQNAAKAVKEETAAEKEKAKAHESTEKAVKKETEETKKLDESLRRVENFIRTNLKKAFDDINDTLVKTENTVIALRRVLNESVEDQKLSGDLYKLAEEYGQTFENVSTIATNFARTGMGWADTIEATKAALVAMNVAELNAGQATDGLIAVMQQFGLEATDLMGIVDKLNKTADNFPATTPGILQALQRTGASAKQANLSLDETVGLIASISAATGRSGANVGTALNSLIQYSSKSGALDIYSGISENVANIVEEYKKGAASIYSVWQALAKDMDKISENQANLLDNYFNSEEGEAVLETISEELGEAYKDITAVYGTANTFRKNYFIALLQNIGMAEDAANVAAESYGYSMKENAEYLDTYDAKLNKLKAKWQELANDEQGLLSLKKSLVEIGYKLLEGVKQLGGIKTIAALAATVLSRVFGAKALTAIGNFVTAIKQAAAGTATFGAAVNTALGVVGLLVTAITMIVGGIRAANQEAHNARLELIQNYDQTKKNYDELTKLVSAYKEADKTNKDYAETENKIVELLGDKAVALEGLKKGTNEYREAIEKLTEAERTKLEQDLAEQEVAAEKELADATKNSSSSFFSESRTEKAGITDVNTLLKYEDEPSKAQGIFDELNISVKNDKTYGQNNFILSALDYSNTAEGNLNNYNLFSDTAATVWDAYKKSLLGDDEEKSSLLLSIFLGLKAKKDELEPYVQAYSKIVGNIQEIGNGAKITKGNTDEWANSLEDVSSKYGDIVEALKAAKAEQKQTADLESKKTTLLEKQKALEEAIAKARKEYVQSVLDDYVKGLESATTLEEKQNDIIKARQALADAKSQRNVSVYNPLTGAFEWRANEKDIASAQDKLNKSVESLNDYIKNQAVGELKTAISNGSLSESGIKNILDKWLVNGEGSGIYTWGGDLAKKLYAAIESGYYDKSKVESQQSAVISAQNALENYFVEKLWDEASALFSNGGTVSDTMVDDLISRYAEYGVPREVLEKISGIIYKVGNAKRLDTQNLPSWFEEEMRQYGKVYDNGGLLSGIGGIKLTSRNEGVVLDPELTQKIVSPVSNKQFSTFVRDLGLLFGASDNVQKRFGSSSIIHNITNGTDSHDKNYNINGVPIPHGYATQYTFAELVDMLSISGS